MNAPHVARQRLTAGGGVLDLGFRVGVADTRRALAEPLDARARGRSLAPGRAAPRGRRPAAPGRASASRGRRCGRPASPAGRPGLLTLSLVCTSAGDPGPCACTGAKKPALRGGAEEAAPGATRSPSATWSTSSRRLHGATATRPSSGGASRAAGTDDSPTGSWSRRMSAVAVLDPEQPVAVRTSTDRTPGRCRNSRRSPSGDVLRSASQ